MPRPCRILANRLERTRSGRPPEQHQRPRPLYKNASRELYAAGTLVVKRYLPDAITQLCAFNVERQLAGSVASTVLDITGHLLSSSTERHMCQCCHIDVVGRLGEDYLNVVAT